MRSSTQRNSPGPVARLTARPSPNFHPITESTTSLAPLLPQARPNVPISETEFPPDLPDRQVHDNNDGNDLKHDIKLFAEEEHIQEEDRKQISRVLDKQGHLFNSEESQGQKPELPEKIEQINKSEENKGNRSKAPNSKLSVLANNNDGIWFLEEKIPDVVNVTNNKREFLNKVFETAGHKDLFPL
jgi:hypothetical protein